VGPDASSASNLEGEVSRLSAEGIFLFSFQADLASTIAVESHGAIIDGLFRHFCATDIELDSGGLPGQLNLGFRLMRNSGRQVVFEDRAHFGRATIESGTWTACQIRIPPDVIDFEVEHELYVDVVREHHYWFAERTGERLAFALSFSDADRVRRDTIVKLQAPALEESLARAFARISELEHSERMLIAERDEYRSQAALLSERLGRDLENIGMMPPPAAIVAEMLRALNPVQRRDRWLDGLSRLRHSGPLFGLYPHDGGPGLLRILVYGSGGYGDMIYLGIIVRELRDQFSFCSIFVMHENMHVEAVFGSNPYVTAAFSLNAEQRQSFMQLANSIDIFDLLVEVKYAVTYTAPPLSRVPTAFQQRALYTSAEWQKYVRYDWPHTNNLFANAVIARGLNKLDLVGLSSLLAINRHSDVDLFVPESTMRIFPALIGRDYVTIHHGADRNMAAAQGVQTKNLSTATWVEVVANLHSAGLAVVQLGEAHEAFVTGVDVDLRGQTALLETAFVIKTARAHIDTEGGLVHVARAVNTTAVVAFGPTPVAFFGYPQNENIPPRICGNCWWVTRKWAAECPRGLAVPECMDSHDAGNLVNRAVDIAKRDARIRIEPVTNFGQRTTTDTIGKMLERIGGVSGNGLILVNPDHDPLEVLEGALARCPDATMLIVAEQYQQFYDDISSQMRVKPYSPGNISFATGAFDWAVGVGMDIRNEKGMHLAVDLRRCVRPEGFCDIIAANLEQPLAGAEWLEHIAAAGARMQGRHYEFEFGQDAFDKLANYLLVRLRYVTP
jgi:ADP-heptose:LPS heptosyltransferase